MGKIWQRAKNTELNTHLADLVENLKAGETGQEKTLLVLHRAREVARRQSLLATDAELKKLEAQMSTKNGADSAMFVKTAEWIMKNAQVCEVDPAAVRITRPTLLYLSGFLTNNDRNDYMIGSIKRMEDLVRGRAEIKEQPDIYGWTHTDLRNLFNLAAYNMCPEKRSSDAGYVLGAAFLMPLVAKNFARDPEGRIAGAPLPADEAKRNVRNLTIFGYSAGSIVAQETYNATLKMMRGVGYDEKTAKDVLGNVVLIAVGNISRPSKERDRYTTVTLAASNDRIMRAKNWIWGLIGTLKKSLLSGYLINKNRKGLSVCPLSETSLFVTASVRKSLYEWQRDEQGERVKKRFFDPLYPSWTMRRSYHELPHYITTDDANNPFSRIALYALVNAFNRNGRTEPLKLIDPPANDAHTPDQQDCYRRRIAESLGETPRALKN